MNYPRVTIYIKEREARESDYPPGHFEYMKLLFGTLRNKAYRIHYNNSEDLPLSKDELLTKTIQKSMHYALATVNRFADTPTNRKYDKLFRDRNKWVKLALQDPLLTEEERKAIQSIRTVDIKKKGEKGEFLSELAKDVKPLVLHLVSVHSLSIKESRGLIIEFLHGWFPNIPTIQKVEDNDTFEKAIRNNLPKNGNN